MQVPATLEELHELVASRVVALDASAYDQGDLAAEWREADTPLNALQEPDFLQHLSFSVLINRAPTTGLDRDSYDETAHHRVEFAVLFVFQLLDGPTGKLGDLKLAYKAARDVVRGVVQDWPASDGIELLDGWFPGAIVNDYLPVRVEFACGLDLSL